MNLKLIEGGLLKKCRKFRKENPKASRKKAREFLVSQFDQSRLTPEQWERILKIIEMVLGVLFL